MDPFEKNFTEAEATGPNGDKVNWTVRVEGPRADRGGITSFIVIEETLTEDPTAKDSLLLDIHAAEWLMGTLYDAIVRAKELESYARRLSK